MNFAVAAQENAAQVLLAMLAQPGDAGDAGDADAAWRRSAVKDSGADMRGGRRQRAERLGGRPGARAREACAACRALGHCSRPEGEAPLARELAMDPDPVVRAAAVDGLSLLSMFLGTTMTLDGVMSAPRAHLAQALARDPSPLVRAEAVTESRRQRDPMWAEAWTAALVSERDPAVLAPLVLAVEQCRFRGEPGMQSTHCRNRCLVALALAPDASSRRRGRHWLTG